MTTATLLYAILQKNSKEEILTKQIFTDMCHIKSHKKETLR